MEVVSYTGEYPNYCSGELTLLVDGEKRRFGTCWPERLRPEGLEHAFWDVGDGEWEIDFEKLPEDLRDLADEIDASINDAIPCRHCGGCR